MIELRLEHSTVTERDFSNLREKLAEIRMLGKPSFASQETDFTALEKKLKPFMKYKNIILVGNGGSINSFKAFYGVLAKDRTEKNLEIICTMEPDFLNEVKAKYSKKDSLVLVISSSGVNIGVIEIMLYFKEYKKLIITLPDTGALIEIARKKKIPFFPAPKLCDRFAGTSSYAFIPAMLFGIKAEKILEGAREMYNKCSPSIPIERNPALKLSAALYELEQKGFTELFIPVYSARITAFLPLIIQLIHETFAKEGKGLTVFGYLAPESQHHTNQRFFGGRKNIAGLFIRIERQEDEKNRVSVPEELKKIKLRDGTIGELNGVPYFKSLEFEFKGTSEDATKHGIPSVILSIDSVNEFSAGELIALLQYFAFYSAVLRKVNPFDQPQVEESKRISFEYRKKFKEQKK
ncbi:MAG: hypothetical protein AB1467_02185 [Candidatus Diapherotrites archaeon]